MRNPAKPLVSVTAAIPARRAKTLQLYAEAVGTSVESVVAEAVRDFVDCMVPARTYYSYGKRLRFLTEAEEAARTQVVAA